MQGAKLNPKPQSAVPESLETSCWTLEPSALSLHLPLQDSHWVLPKPLSPPGRSPSQSHRPCNNIVPSRPPTSTASQSPEGEPLQVEELRLRKLDTFSRQDSRHDLWDPGRKIKMKGP